MAKKPAKYGEFLKNPNKIEKFLDLVARGFTLKEAAIRIGVSSKGVEKYVTQGRKYKEEGYSGQINADIQKFEESYTAIIEERGWRSSPMLKLNSYVIGTIAELIASGFTLQRAATQLGIAPHTAQQWIARGRHADPTDNPLYLEFAIAVDSARAVQEQEALDRMRELRESRSEKVSYEATAWELEHVHGYSKTNRNVNINQTVEYTVTTAPKETGYQLTELEWQPNQALEEGTSGDDE